MLKAGAACSGADACCNATACALYDASAQHVCRAPSHPQCDLPETCDGVRAACPSDLVVPAGASCTPTVTPLNNRTSSGACFLGECRNHATQCMAQRIVPGYSIITGECPGMSDMGGQLACSDLYCGTIDLACTSVQPPSAGLVQVRRAACGCCCCIAALTCASPPQVQDGVPCTASRQCFQGTCIRSSDLATRSVAYWHTGPWSECSAPCGGGQQTRAVTCRDAHDDEVPERMCIATVTWLRPADSRECSTGMCWQGSKPLTVTAPAATARWESGGTYAVQWTLADAPGDARFNVTLYLETNEQGMAGGANSKLRHAASIATNVTAAPLQWQVPATPAAQGGLLPGLYRVVVTVAGGDAPGVAGESAAFAVATPDGLVLEEPGASAAWVKGLPRLVRWTTAVREVAVLLRLAREAEVVPIAVQRASVVQKAPLVMGNQVMWTPPTTLPAASGYRVELTGLTEPFTVLHSPPLSVVDAFEITLPAAVWVGGQTYTIAWRSNVHTPVVTVMLHRNGQLVATVATNVPNTQGAMHSLQWAPPEQIAAGEYRVAVEAVVAGTALLVRSQHFRAEPRLRIHVTDPQPHAVFTRGNTYALHWSSDAPNDILRVQLRRGGQFVSNIAVGAMDAVVFWNVAPHRAPGEYAIRFESQQVTSQIVVTDVPVLVAAEVSLAVDDVPRGVVTHGQVARLSWTYQSSVQRLGHFSLRLLAPDGETALQRELALADVAEAADAKRAGFTRVTYEWTVPASAPGVGYTWEVALPERPPVKAAGAQFNITAAWQRATLRLSLPFDVTGATASPKRAAFVSALARDVATALAVPPARLRVLVLRRGSVLATLAILGEPAEDALSPAALAQALAQQVRTPGSALFQGEYTHAVDATFGVEVEPTDPEEVGQWADAGDDPLPPSEGWFEALSNAAKAGLALSVAALLSIVACVLCSVLRGRRDDAEEGEARSDASSEGSTQGATGEITLPGDVHAEARMHSQLTRQGFARLQDGTVVRVLDEETEGAEEDVLAERHVGVELVSVRHAGGFDEDAHRDPEDGAADHEHATRNNDDDEHDAEQGMPAAAAPAAAAVSALAQVTPAAPDAAGAAESMRGGDDAASAAGSDALPMAATLDGESEAGAEAAEDDDAAVMAQALDGESVGGAGASDALGRPDLDCSDDDAGMATAQARAGRKADSRASRPASAGPAEPAAAVAAPTQAVGAGAAAGASTGASVAAADSDTDAEAEGVAEPGESSDEEQLLSSARGRGERG